MSRLLLRDVLENLEVSESTLNNPQALTAGVLRELSQPELVIADSRIYPLAYGLTTPPTIIAKESWLVQAAL